MIYPRTESMEDEKEYFQVYLRKRELVVSLFSEYIYSKLNCYKLLSTKILLVTMLLVEVII